MTMRCARQVALQVLTQSRYLDYVRANHGWFEDMRGPGKHYRVWTENEVLTSLACEPPTVCFVRRAHNQRELNPTGAAILVFSRHHIPCSRPGK